MAEITNLIDKQDNCEIIRDQIAAILATEIANQKQIATDAGKTNPSLWDFAVTTERAKPWDAITDSLGKEQGLLKNGLVNVYFDSDSLANAGSDLIQKQIVTGTFIIDCYGFKSSVTDGTEISQYGDTLASKEAERVARLVRNILMSAQYMYLKLGRSTGANIVQKRLIKRREKFFPMQNNLAMENVVGERLTLEVDYIELSPQEELETLETLIVDCVREDGFIYFTYEE